MPIKCEICGKDADLLQVRKGKFTCENCMPFITRKEAINEAGD
jgi:hypothetical protein